MWIQCSGANFEQNVGWTQLSADHSSISSSFGLQQQHSKRNPRTKHEKLHYKKVINHATYINYHCWMGPWTFIKLFGVFGALAAPSALTLPWPYYGLFTWSKVQNFLQNVQSQKFCKKSAKILQISLQLFCNFFATFLQLFCNFFAILLQFFFSN